MALQEAHHPRQLVQHAPLRRRRQQRRQPSLAERILTVAAGLHEAAGDLQHAARVGVHDVEDLVHETQEVLAEPRDPHELGPVRALVEGQPQAELAGGEPVAALKDGDVRADVVHHVLVVGFVVLDDEQVVLAQDPRRHPAEQRPDLGAADHPCDLVHRAGFVDVLVHAVGQRAQQALEGRHVGPDPRPPVDDAGACRGGRPQADGLGHELFGLLGGLGEVAADRTDRRRAKIRLGAALGHPEGDPLGQIPVDGLRHDSPR